MIVPANLPELGRIRMGKRGARGEPVKLKTWRLTSHRKDLLDAAAELYGGEVTLWKEDMWELVTEASTIPVIVPTGHKASQFFEEWSKGGCFRRCDGQRRTDYGGEEPAEGDCIRFADEPCKCLLMTRLNFILVDLPGLGIWRLDSQGWGVGAETAAVYDFLAACGSPVIAYLRLETREKVKKGQPKRIFSVAVLDVQTTPRDLMVPSSAPALPEANVHTVPTEGDVDDELGDVSETSAAADDDDFNPFESEADGDALEWDGGLLSLSPSEYFTRILPKQSAREALAKSAKARGVAMTSLIAAAQSKGIITEQDFREHATAYLKEHRHD